jgi:sterol 3beta-glucosyltransferase
MKLITITFGTEGDTRPLLALCHGLRRRGHEVTFMAAAEAGPAARNLGLEFSAISGDMRADGMADPGVQRLMQGQGDVTQLARSLARIANMNTAAWMEQLVELARDADGIVYSGLASFVGLSVGEHLGRPAVGAAAWPLSPTAEFPSALLPPRKLPRFLNRASHELINALLWWSFRRAVNEARRKIGQEPRRKMWQGHPIVYGMSSYLVPRPLDWTAELEISGAWTLPTDDWQAPPALEAFLSAGPPPIYVGFGSMAGFDSRRLLDVLVRAIDGRRALFFPGWSGIDPAQLPGNFHVIGSTPHSWLFPRTAAIIHHGGAGTTHAAAAAGVPSIVLPFAADQPFWAARLHAAGVAPAHVSGAKISPAELASMLAYCEREEVRRNAQRLAASMAKEDGIDAAVRFIERICASSQLPEM